mgnify:CR=1 FL=1
MKRKTYFFERGNWTNKKEEVKPKVPRILNKWDIEWKKNRLGLSKWIVSKENPLTARSTALESRLWTSISYLIKFTSRFRPPELLFCQTPLSSRS